MSNIMTQNEVQDQVDRLQVARQKAEEFSREKSRLLGELGALEKQKKDLEKKCTQEFGCDISGLPNMIKSFRSEAERALQNAEIALGLREGTIKASKKDSSEKSASVESVEKSLKKSDKLESVNNEEDEEDEDAPLW